ncbi:MAG: SDR family oxidoreductase [Selenomonadaceae bacterium]|nr:SDR family oxidoreductase [Selenomonadaceae bacterium]
MEKMIFVIGAGSGLGNGVAEKFARQGFKLVLMARNEERLAGYAAYFADKGYDAETKMVDVTDFSAFAQTFQTAVQEYGIPNVVFYNVGITAPDDKSKLDAQTLVDHYIADVAGAYNVIKLAVTEDFAAKKGAILVTGGGLALQPYIDYLPLSMDKAALRAMVQALAPSLKERGIYIGTVQVTGRIGSNEHFSPKTIAEKFWKLYERQETHEIVY